MLIRPILLAILTLAFVPFVQAQDDPNKTPPPITFVMSSKTEFRGRLYEYNLNSVDVKDTPSWNWEVGEPPLSISSAIRIARNSITIFSPNTRGWEVGSIRLTMANNQKWYYFVSFICTKPECVEGKGDGFNILVKMDGKVLQPTFLPDSPPKPIP